MAQVALARLTNRLDTDFLAHQARHAHAPADPVHLARAGRKMDAALHNLELALGQTIVDGVVHGTRDWTRDRDA